MSLLLSDKSSIYNKFIKYSKFKIAKLSILAMRLCSTSFYVSRG